MHWIRKRCHALIRGSDYLIEFIGAFSKSRAHRAVRWISLILFLLIAIVLAFSTVWRVLVIKTDFSFVLGSGAVDVDWSPPLMRMAVPVRITKDVGIDFIPWKSGELFPPSRIGTVYFPLWIPTVFLAIVTSVLWRNRLRSAFRARNPAEFCKSCGYNLKGSVVNVHRLHMGQKVSCPGVSFFSTASARLATSSNILRISSESAVLAS